MMLSFCSSQLLSALPLPSMPGNQVSGDEMFFTGNTIPVVQQYYAAAGNPRKPIDTGYGIGLPVASQRLQRQ